MKPILFAGTALLTACCGSLPAVDSQLLGLVMPDAKVLAGVNVTQARSSPFGQYLLSQMTAGTSGLAQMTALTGFDPTRDVNELLWASNATASAHGGLATAAGTFNVSSIVAFAASHGSVAEPYAGVTILEDPHQQHGIAFLSGSLVAAGDLADLKAALDRRSNPSILPAALVTQAQQLSAAEDAWVLTTVSPASLRLRGAPVNGGPLAGLQNALSNVQSFTGGVKFGDIVNLTAQAQADNAQDATSLAGALQLLVSMAQLNGAKNPQAAAALRALTATAQGSTVTVALSLPENQFQQAIQLRPQAARPHVRRQPR